VIKKTLENFNGSKNQLLRYALAMVDIVVILSLPLLGWGASRIINHDGRIIRLEEKCEKIPAPEVKQELVAIEKRLERIENKLYE